MDCADAGSDEVLFVLIWNHLLDTYTTYATSVTAAVAVLRSILGTLLRLGGLDLYNAFRLGWGNRLLAFILMSAMAILVVSYIHGEGICIEFDPKL